jgi:hypothetical protein
MIPGFLLAVAGEKKKGRQEPGEHRRPVQLLNENKSDETYTAFFIHRPCRYLCGACLRL